VEKPPWLAWPPAGQGEKDEIDGHKSRIPDEALLRVLIGKSASDQRDEQQRNQQPCHAAGADRLCSN
jgi:hypothetical protein